MVYFFIIAPMSTFQNPIYAVLGMTYLTQYLDIEHVNNIPTMQYFNGTSRNTQSKSLSVSGISKIMHCGILIHMPYCNGGFFTVIDLLRRALRQNL